MKLKGSIAVFAVAAAFAGNVAAGDMGLCLQAIGFTGADHVVNPANTINPQAVDAETGVWKVISQQQQAAAFLGNKYSSSCLVPKNVKGKGSLDQVPIYTADGGKPLTVDQCSFYQSLGSADAKLWAFKTLEAVKELDTLKAKAKGLSDPSVTPKPKLTAEAAAAIGSAVDAAITCIGS